MQTISQPILMETAPLQRMQATKASKNFTIQGHSASQVSFKTAATRLT